MAVSCFTPGLRHGLSAVTGHKLTEINSASAAGTYLPTPL